VTAVWRDVGGILLLDKSAGLSSNQALQKVRRLYAARKAGHTGSLDPLATGLLPICFGEATKIAGYLLGSRKAYSAVVQLGSTTDTDDAEGVVLQTRPVSALSIGDIESALHPLRGKISQTPPAYSALKQGGVPMYKRARRGESVEIAARPIEIHRLDLIEHAGDRLHLHVECGSGTYVRSLARDLGERLGCGAHLAALRRLWVEPFLQPVMHTFDELERAGSAGGTPAIDGLLLPLESGLEGMPTLRLHGEQALLLRQGKRFVQAELVDQDLCRALDADGRLVALIEVGSDGEVRVKRGFNPSGT
jgi:tRNA pseudouridine55 synthase